MRLKNLYIAIVYLFQISMLQAHVTIEDLKQIQKDLDAFDYQYRTGRCVIFNENMTNVPSLEILPINADKEDKSVCIVTYASLNHPYNRFLDKLIDSLHSNFKGHLLYRNGGWPNSDGGCYDHAFSPYGFKACAIQEAYNLGYKKVLWLDSIIEAINDISPLFDLLEENPVLYRYSNYPFSEHASLSLIQEFQLSGNEISSYRHIASGVFGFNFDKPICTNVLAKWHEYSKRRLLWSATFPEQMILSVILCKLGLDNLALDNLIHFGDSYSKEHFFRIDYSRKNNN